MRRNPKPSVEQTAAAVDNMTAGMHHPTTLPFQAAASAVGPAVFPTERWRKDTKEAMLREFRRPIGQGRADAGSQDGFETTSDNVVRVETSAGVVTLADMEPISDDAAAEAAELVARIVARHDDRTHLS